MPGQQVQFPLDLELRRSRLLAGLTILLHLLAVACVWLLPWPLPARSLLLLPLAISAWRALRPSPFVGIRLGARGEFALRHVRGDIVACQVQPETTVFGRLVVLRVRDDQARRRSLTVLPDSVSADQFRLLRVWLRWRAAADVLPPGARRRVTRGP
ncbi:protein YgfX [Accumulibacter sp.]|uniref:protein YgfX n=1 Tax=Accumulibacter sp. TaxID=2053492 RepID=UPI001ACD271F|nr:protein YgfX [Accumulibacter sp.]MBN8453897.1 hypothetical protein [Accumulibacter sp.]MBO3707194.1 hypothetical protein [Candidatus Accumulibacter conexus]